MARTKKTEINPIENILKDLVPKTKSIDWNGITIEIKNSLGIKDASIFASTVADICFTNSEDYIPEVFGFAVGIATLAVYTNFKLPELIDDQYSLITFTDIISKVTECIEATDQYADVIEAAKERIDYRVETNVNIMRRQAAELFESVESILLKLKDTFSGIENEDMQGLIKTLASGAIDEEKIMKAYLENKK